MSEEEKKAIDWFREDLAEEKENCGKYNDYKKQVIRRNERLLNLIDKQQKEIKNLAKRQNDLIDEYENELLEKNNYIFQLENEREALHKLIDEEM